MLLHSGWVEWGEAGNRLLGHRPPATGSCRDGFPTCFDRSEKTGPGHLEVNRGLVLAFPFHPRERAPDCRRCPRVF